MKTITIQGYPVTLIFKVRTKLPKFKYPCKVRDKILKRRLSGVPEALTCHAPGDFTVELVETVGEGEVWHVGS